MTLAYTDSLGARTVITPGRTVRDVQSPTLLINWTASDSGDVARYLVGWTVTPTLSVAQIGSLSAYGPTEFEHEQAVGEAQELYAHVIAEDISGNQTVQTLGPIYTDYTGTPAYVAMDDREGRPYHGWMEDSCNLIGVDRRAARSGPGGAILNAEQKLYLTWNITPDICLTSSSTHLGCERSKNNRLGLFTFFKAALTFLEVRIGLEVDTAAITSLTLGR